VQNGRIKLDIAQLVDNGNTVPMAVSVDSPMTAADHVTAMAVFNERNPQREVIKATLGPRAGKAQVATRIRLATSQKLVAVARLSDGSVLAAHGRCGRDAGCVHRGRCGPVSTRTLINMPKTARRGEVIEIRVTIGHPMETGYRPGADGKRLPRDIIQRFSCRYDGETVFAADAVPRHLSQPVHCVPHGRHAERHHGIPLGGRQWLCPQRAGGTHVT
jgi:hypothetical protein